MDHFLRSLSMGHVLFIVVDDEPEIGTIYQGMLKKEIKGNRCKFEFFTSAKLCLDFLNSNRPKDKNSILISDIFMPGMNGFELIKKLNLRYPLLDIYISSAYYQESHGPECQVIDFNGHFEKPVDFPAIRRILCEKYLNCSEQNQN